MRRNGFSLLELIVTLAVAGLIATVSIPTVSAQLRDSKRRLAVRQFVSTQSLAKATAIAYRRVAELHIDEENGQLWIEVDTSQAGGVKDTVGAIIRIPQGVEINSNRDLVCFDPRGLPTDRGNCDRLPLKVEFKTEKWKTNVETTKLGKVLR
jgi:prepilin-type N-terminal cleavage/methylation domain-containing protein